MKEPIKSIWGTFWVAYLLNPKTNCKICRATCLIPCTQACMRCKCQGTYLHMPLSKLFLCQFINHNINSFSFLEQSDVLVYNTWLNFETTHFSTIFYYTKLHCSYFVAWFCSFDFEIVKTPNTDSSLSNVFLWAKWMMRSKIVFLEVVPSFVQLSCRTIQQKDNV